MFGKSRSLRLFLLGFVALLVAIGLAAGVKRYVIGPHYRAQSLLHISRVVPGVMPDPEASATTAEEYQNYQHLQEKSVRGRLVLDGALSDRTIAGFRCFPKNQNDRVQWLSDHLEVSFDHEIMTLSLTGEYPNEVVALVNAVTDAYVEMIVDYERHLRVARLDKLMSLHDSYQATLRNRRANLEKLAEAAGSSDDETLAFKRQLYLAELQSYQKLLSRNRRDQAECQAELDLLPAEGSDQERAKLQKHLAVLQRVDADLKAKYETVVANAQTTLRNVLDLEGGKEEVEAEAEVARRLRVAMECLSIEMQAAPRIRLMEQATAAERLY